MKKQVLALILSGCLICMMVGCGAENTKSNENETQEPTKNTQDDSAESEKHAEEKDERGIPGSSSYDITLGLENSVGFEKADYTHTPDENGGYDTISTVNFYEDPALGVSFDYSITADIDYEIIGAVIGITNSTIPEDAFVSLAQNYLGYVSTVPYDTADPETTRTWIEEQIPTVADLEDGNSLTVGGVTFELYGTPIGDTYGSFWLDIHKAE